MLSWSSIDRLVEANQFLTLFHHRAVRNDPDDRAAAGDLAADFDVARAFEIAVFGDRDQQSAATDALRRDRKRLVGAAVTHHPRHGGKRQADDRENTKHNPNPSVRRDPRFLVSFFDFDSAGGGASLSRLTSCSVLVAIRRVLLKARPYLSQSKSIDGRRVAGNS